MSISFTSTSTTSKITANNTDVITTDVSGEVSAKINGQLQPIQSAIFNSQLGVGQTWKVSGKLINTNYINDTGKPIMIIVNMWRAGQDTTGSEILFNDTVAIPIAFDSNSSGGCTSTGSIIIPTGVTWRMRTRSTYSGYSIYELS